MTMLSAMEIYESLTFNNPGSFFNKPAPDPLVAFTIGGILSTIGFIWWVRRYLALKEDVEKSEIKSEINMNLKIRMMISAAIDNDLNRFVMVTYSAVSFLFLGGLQVAYQSTLLIMFIFYTFSSSLESVRIMLAYKSVGDGDQRNLRISSKSMRDKFLEYSEKKVLKPANVYEDLGRNLTIVTMVFITQVVLISFVCVDIRNNNLNNCLDGTKGCPVAGTLGSWLFFILGIFMALVFQLGPKTKFGESEQNPYYWLRLFLVLKKEETWISWNNDFMALVFQLGPKTNFGESEQNPYYWLRLFLVLKNDETWISWNNDMKGIDEDNKLHAGDIRVWIRYFMSFLINGVGFHILVHALPLQVASQSSLTGVVFRAIGMMYLVDLDDTPGYKLTIHDNIHDTTDSNKEEDIDEINEAIKEAHVVLNTLKELAQKKQKLSSIISSNVVNKGKYSSVESKNTEIDIDV
eukprot:CAMPEP_0198275744 /NCGR_PEP_ID=MMETSP1447-20131203/64939_1 /TAXON_ID=420782 /ORGANISM="Chaetoceros dichaeta, Strain CCMP1751" /LENGTH=462 /DNA_ID=CAMNT_0043970639 /DNA_START=46 /DNA_END=1434 /DNA_ORIENTATION=+